MFLKTIIYFNEKFIYSTADFFADLGEWEESNSLNPLFYIRIAIGRIGLVLTLVFICFLQIFIYSYYWILLTIYQTKILIDFDDKIKIQWCNNNKLDYYDFRPFYTEEILLFNKQERYFIGFKKKKDALYFKMNHILS